MAENLAIKKRVTHIEIESMQAPVVAGVKMCLNGCGKPVPDGNRKYCSVECASQFWAKHSQKGMREYLFKRDHGTCQMCGWKNQKSPKSRNFTADHKIPIALGGAEFDLNNVWLICEVCDKKKTAQDQGKIAKRRKLIKRVGKNGKPLSAFLKGEW